MPLPLIKPGPRRPRQVHILTIMIAVAVVALGCGFARAIGRDGAMVLAMVLLVLAFPVAIGVAYAMLSSWLDRLTFGWIAAWWRSRRRAAPRSPRPGD